MSGFDPEAYFNNRFAGLVNVDSGEATPGLTSKQSEVVRAKQDKLARLSRIQEQTQYNLENTVVGKLGLNPDRGIGQAVNKVASSFDAVQDFAAGVKGAALNGYASLQESVVDEQAKEAYERHIRNIATPQDQEVLNARPFVPGGGDMSNLERLEHALSIRGVNDSINKATDLESLVAYDIEGNKPSSFQRRIAGDGLLTGVKGAIRVPEMAVGLASMVSGGHAGKYLEEAGFRPEESREFLDGLKTWEQQYADQNVGQAEGFWDTLAEIAENPSVIPHAVGESIPSMLAGGLLGRGLQALGAGSKVAAAAGEGLVMAGSAAEGIRQQTEDGLLSLKQTAAAGGTGIMGAAVNRLSGGLANRAGLGDIDEALVKGALGTSTKPVVPRTVGAAGLEGGEEAVQSSGEQVLQNVALDRPYDEGVGNATAMGLVTGTAMGSVMGGASREQKEALARYDDAQKATDKAAETGDVEALVNPKSATYNPLLGARALMRHIEKADLAPEQKEAKSQELVSLVGGMQSSLDKKKATLAEYAPERVQEMQAELDQRKTELAAVDPADTETVAEYTQYITALEKRIAVRSDADSRKRAQTAVETLETQLETARKYEQRVTGKVAETAQATIKQAIETPDTVEPTVLEKAVAESFTLSMRNPEALTDSTLDYLINSPSIKLDDAQRKHLRLLSASRVAENQLKDFGAVSDEIRLGSDKNKGMKQYRSWITSALNATTPDEVTARREIKDLQNFASSHIKKVTALKSALDSIQEKGGSVQVVPDTEGNWGPATQPLSMKAMTEAGGFTVTRASAGRINEVRKEAAALKSLLTEMKSLYKLRTSSVEQAPAVVAPPEPVAAAAEASEVIEASSSPANTPSQSEDAPTNRVTRRILSRAVTRREDYRVLGTERYVAPNGTTYQKSEIRVGAAFTKEGSFIENVLNAARDMVAVGEKFQEGNTLFSGSFQRIVESFKDAKILDYIADYYGKDNKDYYADKIQGEFDRLSRLESAGSVASIESYVNHSGGAKGADTAWDSIGRRFGVSKHRHYQKDKTPLGNTSITPEQFQEGLIKAKEAAKMLGRNWSNTPYIQGLLSRNWQQVKNADAVFAIAEKLEGDFVSGGTGYAVAMARAEGKPVFVFDQSQGTWFRASEKGWEQSPTPTLTPNFAGIGTRQLSAEGRQAIEDVYAKTKASLADPAGINTVDLNPILDQENGVNDQTESAALPAEAGTQAAADTDMPTADQAPVVQETEAQAPANFVEQAARVSDLDARERLLEGQKLLDSLTEDLDDAGETAVENLYTDMFNENSIREAFAPVRARIARLASPEFVQRMDAKINELATDQDLASEEAADILKWMEGLADKQDDVQPDLFEEAVVDGRLKLFAEASGKPFEAANYLTQNRVAEDFEQMRHAKKPLTSVTDFMSKIKSGKVKFQSFIEGTLTDEQHGLLNRFVKAAGDWQDTLQGQLKRMKNKEGDVLNESFAYDFMQFLHDDDLNLEENISTAMSVSAYGWILEASGKPRLDNEEAVNAKIGRKQDLAVPPALMRLLSDKGTTRNLVVNRLGDMAIQTLGLRLKKDAPSDSHDRLRIALGGHILAMLEEQGIVEASTVSDKAVVDASRDKRKYNKGNHVFIRLVMKNGELNQQAQSIVESARQTEGAFNKVFGVESAVQFPAHTAPKMRPETHVKGLQKTPDLQWKILKKVSKRTTYLRADSMQVVTQLNPEIFEQVAGVVEVDVTTVHKAHRKSQEAKNDGLRREIAHLMEYFQQISKIDASLDVPFHLTPTTSNNQRVMLKENGINPQTSKVHRFVTRMGGWVSNVSMGKGAGDTSLINFQLRVMEGLGVKSDEQSDEATLAKWDSIENDPTYRAAAQAIRDLIWNETVTPESQDAILAGVLKGKEKMHSFDALMGLADYLQAQETGKQVFTSHMMGEVDGKTNGPMLSLWLLGAMTQHLAPKGGFMLKSMDEKFFGAWKALGNLDLYQTLASDMTFSMQEITEGWALRDYSIGLEGIDALYRFTGVLRAEDGSVSKDARNLVKTPLTGLMYGSSVFTALDSMAEETLDRVYARMESLATKKNKSPDSMEQIVRDINALLTLGMSKGKKLSSKQQYLLESQLLPETMTLKQGMEWEFSDTQASLFKEAFQVSLGKATRASLQENLGDFMAARTQINNTLQAAYAIYDQMYALERGRYEEELMDAGLMAFKRNKDEVRVPLHDLTAEQNNVLRERVKAFEPRLHTASSQSGSTEGAVFATQSERHMNSDPRYSTQIAFNGRPRMEVRAMSEMMKDPGVSGMAKSVQSTDSFIAMNSYAQVEALNVHDALGLALKDMVKGANSLNKHTFEALLNYSIPEQTYLALERTALALAERIKTEGDAFDLVVLRQIHLQIKESFGKEVEGVPFERLIADALDAAKYAAYSADKAKLELMLEVDTFDQYTLEKGVYQVTDKDREAIEAKLKTLQPALSAEVQAAADLLTEKAKGLQAGKVAEAQQEAVEEDNTQELSPLEAALKAKPVMPAKEVFGLVEQALLATPTGRVQNLNRKLLKMLANTVDAGLEIRYVTPNTPKSELKGEDIDNSLGWFTTEGGTPTIYLRSTDSLVGNLTPELVLHELVHGALAQTIEAELAARKANPDEESEVLDLIDELELLRVQAEAFIAKDAKLQQDYAPAIENVHELISWGMTNQGFQRDVLNQMTFKSQRKGPNSLIKAMRKFIDSVVGILFNGSTKTEKEQAASALTALITNTSGLFYEAGVTRTQQAGLTLRQRSTSQQSMDTLQVFDSLAQANKPMSQDQTARLQALVSGVMSRLQGPFGVLKAQMQSTQATDPLTQMMQAKVLGILPFSASTATAGIDLNEQETFALELAQLTFQETLDSEFAQGTRKQIVRLYEEARRNPNIRTALNAQQWDHVFNSKGQGSEYLARFAALAMVWEPLHDQMSFETDKDTRKVSQMKLGERIQWLWEQLLDALQHRLFKVYAGQQADEQLSVLARRLVDLEYRKQNRRTGPVGAARERMEDALDGMSTKTKQQVLRVLESPMLDQHKNAFVRAASSIAAASVDDRVGQMVDAGKVLRDRMYQGKLGLMAGVINEMREGNKVADLLLLSTKFLETVRMKIKTDFSKMSLNSFAEKGEYLTQKMKDAVTKVVLRTDMQALLGPFDSAGLLDLMTDKAARDRAIAQYEAQLSGPFKDAYIQGVKQLAYRMAVKVKGYNTQQNALGIALRLNTPDSTKVSLEEGREIAKVLDPLVSLYALEYTDDTQRIQAAQVMRKELERDDNGNGIEVILKLHRHMQKESAEKLFKDSELLMMKGYLPEVYNPHTEIITAPTSEVERMKAQGYEVVGPLKQDDTDIVLKDLVLLRLTDRGLPNRQTGVVTITGQHHKGTEVHAPLYSRNGYVNKHAARINRAITRAVQAQPIDPNYDPRKDSKVYMAPVINAVGEAAGYRYLMSEQMKDQLLERNNSFDLLLGALESNIFDKSNVTQQNRKAFEALKEQYDQDYTRNPDAYITFGPDSTDAAIRETWRVLPEASKAALRDVWGSDNLMVRNDIYDQTFGYSAYSLSKIMELDEAQRNFAEDMFFKMADWMVRWQLMREGHTGVDLEDRAKRAALMIRRGEDRWMEVIRVVKDILVVKTGATLLWNIVSNYTQLWLSGVPLMDIAKNSWVALQGVLDYRKDESELTALRAQLASGAVVGDVREVEQKILRLENTLAKSPVRSLIEAGLLSSIVEDVDTADSDYSYKSRWVKSLEQHADRVPDALKSVAKVAFVTHDTALYRVLSQGTQVSDFVARYTLYQQLVSRKKNPLSHEDAVLKVSRAFVNYDKPSHQMLDYANRVGLVYFTKYYLRIQHVIMDLIKENPARALMLLAFDGYLDGAQTIVDSAVVNQIGNPLDVGAFKMLDAWDESLPIQAISSLIK